MLAMGRDDSRGPSNETWITLHGGNVNTVSRKGDVVKRQTSPASPAIHQFLRWLEARAFEQVPRLLHVSAGEEFLTYLPGEPVFRPWPEAVKSTLWLCELGDWLRRYHEAARGFRLADGAAFLWGPIKPEANMTICHGDLGPWNCLQRGGRLIGVIDWDLARYGDPLDDVAELALEAVPLRPPSEGTMGLEVTRGVLQERLSAFCEAYQRVTPTEVVRHVPTYLQRVISETETQAERGVEPFVSFVKGGIVKELMADLAHVNESWTENS